MTFNVLAEEKSNTIEIQNPKDLKKYKKKLRIEQKKCKKNTQKVNHLNFLDHHKYTLSDIQKILKEYNKDKSIKKLILTTEKDAVKLMAFKNHFRDINVYILPINIALEKQEEFEKQIINYVENNKRNS